VPRGYDREVDDAGARARATTRREVLKYGLSASGLLCLATMAAAPQAPTVAAAGMRLIDFTEHLVPADQVKAAGYAGALVYVSESRPGANFDFKPVTPAYADALRANGLHVVSCYQFGKPGWPTPSDYTFGYDGGVSDAHTALGRHTAAGGPDTAPIFFSVDEDIDHDTWTTLAVNWFRGINSVLGTNRTGIYGHANACRWAVDDGVIGASSTAGHFWAWQTMAWSRGVRTPEAVLFQSAVNTAASPGPLIGGVHVDVDVVLAPDFGQWDLRR
jgi:Domain of unknown function (DUF1906)